MNKDKLSKILVRFLKSKFLKLITMATVFPVIVMLKLTKFPGIKENNSFQLQHVFDKHMVLAVNALNINHNVPIICNHGPPTPGE